MFECNVTGRVGSTVWKGTVLDCSSSDNVIILLHSRFANDTGTGTCNNGAVVARQGLYDNEEGWYTSQLNISINFTSTGNTVKCSYDNGTLEQVIGYYMFELNYDGLTFCTTFSDDNIGSYQ